MWNIDEERLLCYMTFDDKYARLVCTNPAPAFFRAFVVQNRQTGTVRTLMRWKYADKPRPRRRWGELFLKQGMDVMSASTRLRCVLEDTLREAALALGETLPDEAINCYYPPDDNGNPIVTVRWLEELDPLIELEVAERREDEQSSDTNSS